MAISDNIQEVVTTIDQELKVSGEKSSAKATQVETLAAKAITGGVADWAEYMKLFAKNDAELARLIPTDGTTDAERQKARAYLVANGTCGSGTTRNLLNQVDIKLDLP